MKYLNLTEGFNPYNAEDDELIKFESFFFNGGEPHIKLDIDSFNGIEQDVQLTMRLKSMNDVGLLMVTNEAVRQCGFLGSFHLLVPYFLGARQDRVMTEGEPLTIKIFAELINDMNFDQVEIFDPHSDVTSALIENCDIINNNEFVNKCITNMIERGGLIHVDKFENVKLNIISPDSGANKKSTNLIKYLYSIHDINYSLSELYNLVKCDKTRDVATGKLSGFEVYSDDLQGRDCVIVDDICDGGGTFIGLAKELKNKNAGDLYLIVSHGIFSKGFKELKKHFKAIYTTNSWVNNYALEIPEIEKGSHIVNIIDFKEFI